MSFDEFIQAYCTTNKFGVAQWSKDKAHKMAFTRYRNTYLGFNLSEKLITEI